jgi:hypothetical protein
LDAAQSQERGPVRSLIEGLVIASLALIFSTSSISAEPPLGGTKPSRSDTPVVNPHPLLRIPFEASVPDMVRMSFFARYELETEDKYQNTPSVCSCQRWVGLVGAVPYAVIVRIDVVHSGTSYRGEIIADLFQPGRCGWQLTDSSWASEDTTVPSDRFALYEGTSGHHPVNYVVDLWCATPPKFDPSRVDCSSLATFPTGTISPHFIASTPVERMGGGGTFGPDAESITLEVHDLALIPGAVLSGGSQEEPTAQPPR